MPKANVATMYLDNAIAEVIANKDLYVNNPGKDFCRNRKLPLSDLIYAMLEMERRLINKRNDKNVRKI